jgi:hypothetical protein
MGAFCVSLEEKFELMQEILLVGLCRKWDLYGTLPLDAFRD